MPIKILIVDDEAPARDKIARFLGQMDEDFELSLAKNAQEAIDLLHTEDFTLMFLDIQMPQMNAFEMLQQMDNTSLPAIIFSTAYDEYALKAFEVHAIDYLLKPYDFKRFSTSVERVLRFMGKEKQTNHALIDMLKSWNPPTKKLDMIWVNHRGKLIPVDVSAIDYLESDGNYVSIHADRQKYLLRKSLKDLHAQLDPQQFVRVHRSFVVNKLRIKEMHSRSHGDLIAVMHNGDQVTVSRRYRDQLIQT